mmetsp:Transcript_18801/g.30716  ORF Transcript_18801/g.30716 Transcript_18801/m.30716 type:complete len:204 (+) Transcript_18801:2042-2653(+)
MGVGAGASALLQYSVLERKKRSLPNYKPAASVQGLILFGVDPGKSDHGERFVAWVLKTALATGSWSERVEATLAGRLFSRPAQMNSRPCVESYIDSLRSLNKEKVAQYLVSFSRRPPLDQEDYTVLQGLSMLLINGGSVGGSYPAAFFSQQPGISQTGEMLRHLGKTNVSTLTVRNAGVLSSSELPDRLLEPIELFLETLGYF